MKILDCKYVNLSDLLTDEQLDIFTDDAPFTWGDTPVTLITQKMFLDQCEAEEITPLFKELPKDVFINLAG